MVVLCTVQIMFLCSCTLQKVFPPLYWRVEEFWKGNIGNLEKSLEPLLLSDFQSIPALEAIPSNVNKTSFLFSYTTCPLLLCEPTLPHVFALL